MAKHRTATSRKTITLYRVVLGTGEKKPPYWHKAEAIDFAKHALRVGQMTVHIERAPLFANGTIGRYYRFATMKRG
jgi:hypothetical protein